MEGVNADLGDKLRPLKSGTFSLHPLLAAADAEPSTVPSQADLLLLGQPVLLEHSSPSQRRLSDLLALQSQVSEANDLLAFPV